MANTHEVLEHAEHAGHHAADPFDKRVAVTMAVVAAALAAIALVGHKTHNAVLALKGDANQTLTDAAAQDVEKSNLFAWYQAKRSRQDGARTSLVLTELLAPAPGSEKAREANRAKWEKTVKDYDTPDDKRESLPQLRERGDEAGKKSADLKAKAKGFAAEAEHAHHMAGRFDIAHLLAEVGLVLCSITLLTKKKGWWFAGIVAVVLALGVTGSAYLMPHHDAHDSHAPGDSHDDHPPAAKEPAKGDHAKLPAKAEKKPDAGH